MRRAFRVTAAAELLHALRRQLGTQKHDYHYHHHVSGVPIMPTLHLDWFMKQNYMFDGSQALPLHGGSWHAESTNQNGWYGFGANNASQFSFGGPMNLNNALMKLENAEYEASFQEVHRLPATMRVQETRYSAGFGVIVMRIMAFSTANYVLSYSIERSKTRKMGEQAKLEIKELRNMFREL